jgi:hypothetical protein
LLRIFKQIVVEDEDVEYVSDELEMGGKKDECCISSNFEVKGRLKPRS